MNLDAIIQKYKLEVVEEGDKKLYKIPNTPLYITVKEENGKAVVRIDVDKERLDEIIQEMIEEGESRDSIEDAIDEMIDETVRIAYEIVSGLEKEKKEVRSELLGSVLDAKEIITEELEYLEEIL